MRNSGIRNRSAPGHSSPIASPNQKVAKVNNIDVPEQLQPRDLDPAEPLVDEECHHDQDRAPDQGSDDRREGISGGRDPQKHHNHLDRLDGPGGEAGAELDRAGELRRAGSTPGATPPAGRTGECSGRETPRTRRAGPLRRRAGRRAR